MSFMKAHPAQMIFISSSTFVQCSTVNMGLVSIIATLSNNINKAAFRGVGRGNYPTLLDAPPQKYIQGKLFCTPLKEFLNAALIKIMSA